MYDYETIYNVCVDVGEVLVKFKWNVYHTIGDQISYFVYKGCNDLNKKEILDKIV